jgi:hypothetical protein
MSTYSLIFPEERLWAVEGVLEALTQEKPFIVQDWMKRSWKYYTERPLDPAEFVTLKQYAGADISEIK